MTHGKVTAAMKAEDAWVERTYNLLNVWDDGSYFCGHTEAESCLSGHPDHVDMRGAIAEALAAVLPEIQAQALRDYADFIVWSGGSEKGLNISPRMLRTRAARLTAPTEEPTT